MGQQQYGLQNQIWQTIFSGLTCLIGIIGLFVAIFTVAPPVREIFFAISIDLIGFALIFIYGILIHVFAKRALFTLEKGSGGAATLILLFIAFLILRPVLPFFHASTSSTSTPAAKPLTPISTKTYSSSPPCPKPGKANAFTPSSSLLPSTGDPAIIYADNDSNNHIIMLKVYDIITGHQSIILSKPDSVYIKQAEISKDGQWILVTIEENQVQKLQMIQINGQIIQTLYCLSDENGGVFQDVKLSPDEKSLVFFQRVPDLLDTVYLLDIGRGILQPELIQYDNTLHFFPFNWVDNVSVYVGAFTGLGSGLTTIGYDILNINVSNQQAKDLLNIVNFAPPYGLQDISNNIDSGLLFVDKCISDNQSILSPCIITEQLAMRSDILYTYNLQKSILGNATVTNIITISNNTLLLFAHNYSDPSEDGIYVMELANTIFKLTPLDLVHGGSVEFNYYQSGYPWSTVSFDSSKYALAAQNPVDSTSNLLWGSVSDGGKQNIFYTATQGETVHIVGWTTI